MTNSEVRAHLRKGELAVALLESMGYRYSADGERERPEWHAPAPKPEDELTASIKKLIKDEQTKAYLAGERHGLAKAAPEQGPNWHLVKAYVSKDFIIRPENIPADHVLSQYGSNHFRGIRFKALSIQYENTATYIGYTVSFNFNTHPYTPKVVRLPLSAVAFR